MTSTISHSHSERTLPLPLAGSEQQALAAVAALSEAEIIGGRDRRMGWLHWACVMDLGRVAQALIARGADPKAPNRDGNTPLELACINGSAAAGLAVASFESQEKLSSIIVAGRHYEAFSASDPALKARHQEFNRAMLFVLASREAADIALSALDGEPRSGPKRSL